VEQIRKQVYSKNSVGKRIDVVQSYSDFEEGYLVANRISQVKMASHDSYEDFAILYRTNAQSRVLEESLRKRNIPYRIYGGLSFYQRKEVKDAIAYFRMAINPDDDEALKRIINYPARGIGETTLNKLMRSAMTRNISIWQAINTIHEENPGLNSGTVKKLNAFASLIDGFVELNQTGISADEMAKTIINRSQLISVLMSDRTPESISKQENLSELISGAEQFVTQRTEEGINETSLSDFLGEVSLATDQDSDTAGEERITLMTVHAAKGLEFNNVFIVGVEEDLLPSAMSQSSAAEIEEERRLLYVAITRARNYCMMSYALSRYRNGMTATCQPSRFLRDISPEYLNLSAGAQIGGTPSPSFASYRNSYHSPSPQPRVDSHSQPAQQTAPLPQKKDVSGAALHTAAELSEGMRIEHPRFGLGVITVVDISQPDARIHVEFDNTGTRVLLLKFARFAIK
nr:ATP-binding domain-containing protein [Paramuribaculum sp.]